ncbi:MAG: VWA domain-containing protein [Lentimicrobiaceae bacterium]|nr:VWA domain-containing protein [Lentimicrobiaceae bacterium]
MQFAAPQFLYLGLLLPLVGLWYIFRRRRNKADIRIPDTRFLAQSPVTFRVILFHSLFVMRLMALALLIIALARPQTSSSRQDITIEGIDIVMALDISGSMLAEDFRPNRLEAAKEVAMQFVAGRPDDRIGLVIFSGEAFTQCPLTRDHAVLANVFQSIRTGMIEDGTAIGDGLATAVNRLKDSKAISKVIILLTDGENNMGAMDPASAAEIARMFGIRIYAIGVGTIGMAPYPFRTPFGTQYQNVEVRIDEPLLKSMAEMTGGQYFRATNNQKLKAIYEEIDQLEKSKIDVTEFTRKKEEFLPLVLAALALLLLEFLFRIFIIRSNP